MNTKAENAKYEYLYFDDDEEFYKWAADAPSCDLIEALSCYFEVLEYNLKLIDKRADYADPRFLAELNGIAWNFYSLGPWIMEVQDQLSRRNDPGSFGTFVLVDADHSP